MSTGMPAGIWLTKFGVLVRDYFGHVPYHVGSSLKAMTGLPIDFQIQPQTWANEKYPAMRSALIEVHDPSVSGG